MCEFLDLLRVGERLIEILAKQIVIPVRLGLRGMEATGLREQRAAQMAAQN